MHGAAPGLQSAPLLKRVNTWMAQMNPFLATPLGGSAPICRLVLSPAAMPATCVPCWQRFVDPLRHWAVSGLAAPGPTCVGVPLGQSDTRPAPPAPLANEKHASAM